MIELGLQRISRLLENVPLPWRAIHVAGTNGKGSICTYVSRMLNLYNVSDYRKVHGQPEIRHGRFTSPHLIDRWDGITIGQEPISKAEFDLVEAAVLARNQDQAIGASEFEIMTATAFEAFTKAKLDVGIVEVGMGGRLDATNVIGAPVERGRQESHRPAPLVTAISSIGLDHQAFLGDTIEKIAAEKAGIIKPEVPVVMEAGNPVGVQQVIERVARQNGSNMVTLADFRSQGFSPASSALPYDELYDLNAPASSDPEWQAGRESDAAERRTPLLANTSVAFRATLVALQRLGRIPDPTPWSDRHLQLLLYHMLVSAPKFPVPGRMERAFKVDHITGRNRSIFLDGAHNAQSAEALAKEIRVLRGPEQPQRITWVLAASDTKDVREILRPLIQEQDQVFAVEFGPVDGMPWVKPAKAATILDAVYDVVPNIEQEGCFDYGNDVYGAVRDACRKSYHSPGQLVVATGSLYLVGHIRRLERGYRRAAAPEDQWLDHEA